jgi:hypothetical protein
MPPRLGRIGRLKLAAQPVVEAPPSVPSPIKGWNTRDALTTMDPLDAIQLDNWYPDASGVNLRNGYTRFAFGLGVTPVKTLAEYNAGAIRKMIAGCNGRLLDVSGGGDGGFDPGFSDGFSSGFGAGAGAYTNDAWQTEQFLSKLFFCNGADTPQVFDGTSFANWSFTGLTGNPPIGVKQYQQRLFFWQNSTTGFWFPPLNSISGALSFYDLSPFSPDGGNLIATTTYSHDGGNGVLDFIVFILSSGWALIYYGNDPSTGLNWQMIGRYRIAPPVNIRAVANYGGEAFVTTFDDNVALSAELQALTEGRLAPRSKISPAVQAAVASNAAGFGWQALYYTKGRRLIFNVPNADGTFSQHVQNTAVSYPDPVAGKVVSPWCRFVNMNAFCWGLFKDNLFFGAADGTIYQADIGQLDVSGAVQATVQQAWNTFEEPHRKRLSDVRPIIQSAGNVNYTFSMGFDYGALNIQDQIVVSETGSPWDISPWDTSPWSAEFGVSTLWRGGGGDGVAAGWGISLAATNSVTYLRTDFRGEIGNAL